MVRLRIILVVMIALLSACSITSKDESEPTAQLIVRTVTVSAPTVVLSPSATSGLNPTPTQGSLAQPTSAAPPVVTNCTVRTDWPVYTVQSGDTLGVIPSERWSPMRIAPYFLAASAGTTTVLNQRPMPLRAHGPSCVVRTVRSAGIAVFTLAATRLQVVRDRGSGSPVVRSPGGGRGWAPADSPPCVAPPACGY
jgi:hypothetical protein